MRRRLFNLAAGLSLLLCAAVCVLWVSVCASVSKDWFVDASVGDRWTFVRLFDDRFCVASTSRSPHWGFGRLAPVHPPGHWPNDDEIERFPWLTIQSGVPKDPAGWA